MIDTYKLYGRYFQLFNFLKTLQNPSSHMDESYLTRLIVEKENLLPAQYRAVSQYSFNYAYKLNNNSCSILFCVIENNEFKYYNPITVNDIFSTIEKTIIIPVNKNLLMLDIKPEDAESIKNFISLISLYFYSVILMDNNIYFETTSDLDLRIDVVCDIMTSVFIKHFIPTIDMEAYNFITSKYKEFEEFSNFMSTQSIANKSMEEILPLYYAVMEDINSEELD